MFRYSYIIGIIIILLMSGCGDTGINHPYISFDTPFPKRFKNLTTVLGDEVSFISETDTETIHIYFNKTNRINIITNVKTGDTLTQCWVSKFRQLYYFTEQLNDTAYQVYAVNITPKTIKGWKTGWMQMFALEDEINKGNYAELVKYRDTAHHITRLTFNKQKLKKFYTIATDQCEPLSIVRRTNKYTEDVVIPQTDTLIASSSEDLIKDETDVIASIFPNPAKGHATITLNEDGPYSVTLYDNKGQAISSYQTDPDQEQYILPLDNCKPGMHIIKAEQSITGKRVYIKLQVTQ